MNPSKIIHPKVCAITGSGGFLGGCLVRYFKKCGWRVVELNRSGTIQAGGNEARIYKLGDGFPDGLRNISAIVHAAYDFRPISWRAIKKINVDGASRLFSSAHQSGIEHLVHISSMSAFSGCKSLYGTAKLKVESHVTLMNGTSLRPGLIYDENDAAGMVGKLKSLVARLPVIPIPGKGRNVLYLSHQDDLCRLVESICSGEFTPQKNVIIASNPNPWMFIDILQSLALLQNKRLRYFHIPWPLVFGALRAPELFGAQLPFKSDSLISLLNQDQSPVFDAQVSKYFRDI